MPSTRLLIAAAAATALLVVVLVVRSNDDEDGEPVAVATDYATYDGEFGGSSFEFAYPEEWGEVSPRVGADADEAFFEVEGETSPEGTTPSVRLGVQLDSASPEAILQANVAAAQAQGGDLEVSDEEPLDVVGAVEALRADATYSAEGSEFGTTIVVAQTPDQTIFSLIVSAAPGGDDLDLETVVDSLRISPAEEEVDA